MTWEDQLDDLAHRRGSALVAYAYLLTGDMHSARDLVQEAFVRTFSRRRSGTDVDRLEGYVRRAILNVYRDAFRKRVTFLGVRHFLAEEVHRPGPEQVAGDRADVRTALARLTPRERACIVLRHYDDLTVPEIAAALSLSEGAVKRYLSDARVRLRPLLDDGAATERVEITRTERRTT